MDRWMPSSSALVLFFTAHREQIIALADSYAIPSIYTERVWPKAGGLMSYSSSATDAYRKAGIYAGRILRGEAPANLPVDRSTKFELVINLETAKLLGSKFRHRCSPEPTR